MEKKDLRWNTVFAYINLGWDLALPIFLGVLLGHYLDKLTNSIYHLSISLLIVGVISGYYNLARAIRKIDKDFDA